MGMLSSVALLDPVYRIVKRERSLNASPAAAPEAVLSKMHHASFGAADIIEAMWSRVSSEYDE